MGLWAEAKQGWMFASIPHDGQQVAWSEKAEGFSSIYGAWVARRKLAADKGLLASISDDGTTVTWKHVDSLTPVGRFPVRCRISRSRPLSVPAPWIRRCDFLCAAGSGRRPETAPLCLPV